VGITLKAVVRCNVCGIEAECTLELMSDGRWCMTQVDGTPGWQTSKMRGLRFCVYCPEHANRNGRGPRPSGSKRRGVPRGFKFHAWISGGEPPAFLFCTRCGMEHTTRGELGRKDGPQFLIRVPGGQWQPRVPPIPPCPGAKPEVELPLDDGEEGDHGDVQGHDQV